MSNNDNELRAQARRTSPQIKIAAGLWVVGIMIIMVITVTWIFLAVTAGDYYGHSKAVRDAAEAGSAVLADLGTIHTVMAWVKPLEVLGLATFLLGFGFAFGNILQNVRLRGNTMAAALPLLKERKTGSL